MVLYDLFEEMKIVGMCLLTMSFWFSLKLGMHEVSLLESGFLANG